MPKEIKNTLFLWKQGLKNYTFPKKAVFYPYKTWILPHKPPLFSKSDFHDNRKGLLRDWKTLMTDNDLDLNDRKMLLRARKSGSDGTFHLLRRQI